MKSQSTTQISTVWVETERYSSCGLVFSSKSSKEFLFLGMYGDVMSMSLMLKHGCMGAFYGDSASIL